MTQVYASFRFKILSRSTPGTRTRPGRPAPGVPDAGSRCPHGVDGARSQRRGGADRWARGATFAAPTILEHGTPEQIAEHVLGIALGQRSWCQLFSEPGSGSDLASRGTRAVLDGDEWVVTGQKVWNSGADQADRGMLLARTDVDQPKHGGLSYFVIDMRQAGVEARPLEMMNGTGGFCEVFLTEARVSGPPGDRRARRRVAGRPDDAGPRAEHGRRWRCTQGLFPAHPAPCGGDLDLTVGEVIGAGRGRPPAQEPDPFRRRRRGR